MKKRGWQEFSSTTESASQRQAADQQALTKHPAQQRVRVQRSRAGKKGKLVTSITGLEMAQADALMLLKTLKTRAGSGGCYKGGVIELQGDQVTLAISALEAEGFRPKQAGG